jgi:hypothetical protein
VRYCRDEYSIYTAGFGPSLLYSLTGLLKLLEQNQISMYRRVVASACSSAAAGTLPTTSLIAPSGALIRTASVASCRALSTSVLCRSSAPAAATSAAANASTAAPAQAPSNPSAVEEWMAKKEAKKRAAEHANPPVPVGEGEMLLYVGGATTKRKYVAAHNSQAGLHPCVIVCATYLCAAL